MFSFEYCEIFKNTFFYRTPPVIASVVACYRCVNSAKSRRVEVSLAARNMKFSIKDFFSKCDQIRSILRIWSHLPKKSLMENFIFCAVTDRHYSADYRNLLWKKINIQQQNPLGYNKNLLRKSLSEKSFLKLCAD